MFNRFFSFAEPNPQTAPSESSWNPYVLVSFSALLVFLVRLPAIDLPVWDDNGIFYFGKKVLRLEFNDLNIEWGPVLVLWTSLIHLLFPHDAATGFYVFHAVGHVAAVCGSYRFLTVLGYPARPAMVITVLWSFFFQSLYHVYDIPALYTYFFGVPLLAAGELLQRKPVPAVTALAWIVFCYLIRNESILVLFPAWGIGVVRRGTKGMMAFRNQRTAAFLWAVILFTLLVMTADSGNFRTERLAVAFSQKFHSYAVNPNSGLSERVLVHGSEFDTMEDIFGADPRKEGMFATLLGNPAELTKFIFFNFNLMVSGDLVPKMPFLSVLLEVGFILAVLALVTVALVQRRVAPLLFAVLCCLKTPLLFITVPVAHYVLDVLFIACVGSWYFLLGKEKAVIASVMTTTLFAVVISPAFLDVYHSSGRVLLQEERADFVRSIDNEIDFRGALFAESMPNFSPLYGSNSLQSSIYYLECEVIDGRLYWSHGGACDYLLLEDGLPLPVDLAQWVVRHEPVKAHGRFRLYAGQGMSETATSHGKQPKPVMVLDDTQSQRDLSWMVDRDRADERTLVIRWDFDRQLKYIPQAYHVYIQEDCTERYRYFAHLSGDRHELEWKPGSLEVSPDYYWGPKGETFYQFKIFAVNDNVYPELLYSQVNAGPVLFQTAAWLEDETVERQDDGIGRKITVYWNPDEITGDPSVISDVHIYVREEGEEEYEFLGKQKNKKLKFFVWEKGREYWDGKFNTGPKEGVQYTFKIHPISTDGKSFLPEPLFIHTD